MMLSHIDIAYRVKYKKLTQIEWACNKRILHYC